MKKSYPKPKIGAHVSAAGGVSNAFLNAQRIGAETIQIFGASPRAWQASLPPASETKKFKLLQKQTGIQPVFLHAPYLVNIATPDEVIYQKSIKNLTGHLKIAQLLGAQGVIFHIGTKKDLDNEEAAKRCAQAIKQILKNVPGKSWLIIENNAGEGKKFGATPEEIALVLKKVNSPRVKVCIDTAHSLESGLIEKYTPSQIKNFFDRWEKAVGKNTIVALHANDSKTPPHSHHDRHENIGEGYIGLNGFKNLAKEKRAWQLPWILEVPGFTGEGPDKKNIERLRKIVY